MSREYLKMGDELLRKVEEQARDMILNARENVALYYYRDVHWGTQTQYIGVQIIARHDGTYNEPWNLEEDYDVLNDLVTDIVNQAKEQRFYKVDEYDDYGDFNEYEEYNAGYEVGYDHGYDGGNLLDLFSDNSGEWKNGYEAGNKDGDADRPRRDW